MAQYKPSDVVTAGGKTQSLTAFAADLGTPVQTILSRLKRSQDLAAACLTPVNSMAANKGKTADADVLDPDEIEALLNAAPKSDTAKRDRVLIILAYRSGLRCSELLALMPKDVDAGRGTISVHHGKGNKARVVAIDPQAWAHVLQWIELRSTWPISDESPLFCTSQGKKLNSRQVRAMFQRRAKRSQITKHAHPHGMRRTMASEMAGENIPLMDIAGALGHSNVSTTNTYLKRINPASVLNAMKSRQWGNHVNNPVTSQVAPVPPPGWIERLRQEIGNRLKHFSDARKSETEFEAVVLLF